MIGVTGIAEPMIEISENLMQLFNEFSVLLISYCLLPLTDFVPDFETRNIIGQGLILINLFNLAVNVILSLA
jgi:hypothetical protein